MGGPFVHKVGSKTPISDSSEIIDKDEPNQQDYLERRNQVSHPISRNLSNFFLNCLTFMVIFHKNQRLL
jgi:hypothetical protein